MLAASSRGVRWLEVLLRSRLHFLHEQRLDRRIAGTPNQPELSMTLAALRSELAGLDLIVAHELERPVVEGAGHRGHAAVVHIAALRP